MEKDLILYFYYTLYFFLQINTLLHDHLEYIRLGPGFIAEYNLQTAISFNLAGEIQISLWNRNSHSVVNQK